MTGLINHYRARQYQNIVFSFRNIDSVRVRPTEPAFGNTGYNFSLIATAVGSRSLALPGNAVSLRFRLVSNSALRTNTCRNGRLSQQFSGFQGRALEPEGGVDRLAKVECRGALGIQKLGHLERGCFEFGIE